ncbi:MAG: zinc metallopeptidase [Chloroflexota bacterium]
MLLYLIMTIPALLLGFYAQYRVKSTFNKYSKVAAGTGIRGADAARRILDANGLYDVDVERVNGFLSDHYDPSAKVLRLSPDVYDTPSLAAVGVAAHEAGHAIQDQQGYAALRLRTTMVPAVQVGGWVGPLMLMGGVLINASGLVLLGVILFSITALFAVVTLPVEFDASRRAKKLLVSEAVLTGPELTGVNRVLDAAALTYVAAALQAIATLLYYVFLLMGSNSD